MALAAQLETIQFNESPVLTDIEVSEVSLELKVSKQTPSNVELQYKNYKSLVDRATEVFGDELTASRWLSMPSVDLANKVPLQVAQSLDYDLGAMSAVFEPIFIRIEHGIYT